MSTVDSQLLVSSSVISEDFYRVFVRPQASEKELLMVSRGAVIAIALLAMVIASDRESRVLDLVETLERSKVLDEQGARTSRNIGDEQSVKLTDCWS